MRTLIIAFSLLLCSVSLTVQKGSASAVKGAIHGVSTWTTEAENASKILKAQVLLEERLLWVLSLIAMRPDEEAGEVTGFMALVGFKGRTKCHNVLQRFFLFRVDIGERRAFIFRQILVLI